VCVCVCVCVMVSLESGWFIMFCSASAVITLHWKRHFLIFADLLLILSFPSIFFVNFLPTLAYI
jgi:hypothetical protein